MTILTRRFVDAVDYARIAHPPQFRKGSGIPYSYHLLGVASLVLEYGGSEDQAIAGLLHDVLEDCGAGHEDTIRAQFGDDVAKIVLACTDGTVESKAHAQRSGSALDHWRERKLAYLGHLRNVPESVLLVSGCDKLHNARAILGDLENPVIGITVFERFTVQTRGHAGLLPRQFVATYTANPPPSPPACPPQPAAETQTVQCPAGTTGTWVQTRNFVSAPAPTCCTAGAWTPASAPAGACTAVPPPPPPPVAGSFPPELYKFAETWDRNWNFEGHVVDSRFTEGYGNWNYTETTYEPWLFDRASVGFYLYEASGNDRWRQKFLSDFAWYRARIDAQGIFTPKGGSDTKYGYVMPFVHYEVLTGDAQYRPVARRIYDSWAREFPATYSPTIGLWTERELGLALEAAVGWYELTQEPAALARANALVAQWTTMANATEARRRSATPSTRAADPAAPCRPT